MSIQDISYSIDHDLSENISSSRGDSPSFDYLLVSPIMEDYGSLDHVIALIGVTNGKVRNFFSDIVLCSFSELGKNPEISLLSKTGLVVHLILTVEHCRKFSLPISPCEGEAYFSYFETGEIPYIRQSLESLGFIVSSGNVERHQKYCIMSANESLEFSNIQVA